MTTAEKDITALVRVEGGIADEGMLDMYDAASMIHGLARGLNMVAHSFANSEEIRVRASTAQGVQTFIHSSKKGCFEEQIDVRFSKKIVDKMGHSVIANNFWDYLAYSWAAATGRTSDPVSSHLQKVVGRAEDFMYDIGDALESAMQDIHKPILRDSKAKIFLARPRIGDILELNKSTLDYVTTRTEKTKVFDLTGNVTRYNVLSDFGRLFSDAEGRVISFRLADPDDNDMKQKVVQSMQDHVSGKPGKLRFGVSQVVSSQGQVRRYIVHRISKA
jgi:hypothetical protein